MEGRREVSRNIQIYRAIKNIRIVRGHRVRYEHAHRSQA